MAVSTRWMLLGALLALFLAGSSCGGDDSGGDTEPGDGDGDGDGAGDGDGDGDGDGEDGGEELPPVLADGVAGDACSAADACAPAGTCADALTGGAIGSALGAGSGAVAGGYCTGACKDDAQCGEGGVCFGEVAQQVAGLLEQLTGGMLPSTDGECRARCEEDGDCREGQECAKDNGQLGAAGALIAFESTCQQAPVVDQLGADVAGKACASDGDCGEGHCNEEQSEDPDAGAGLGGATNYPGGYCSGVCKEDAHCGANGTCVPALYGSGGSCFESCETDADCARDADGYGCRDQGGRKLCLPKPNPLPSDVVGAACSGNAAACGPGECAETLPGQIVGIEAPPDEPAPGGYCTLACGGDEDCGEGGACVLLRINPLTSLCLKTCTSPADCPRDGYTCGQRGLGEQVCVPGDKPDAPDGGIEMDGGA